MISFVPGAQPDPERARHALSIWTWKTVTEVAAAVSAGTNHGRLIYVERWTNVYRWRPAHRGGAYPLMRTMVAFLGVDHRQLVVGFHQLENAVAIVGTREQRLERDAWELLEFDGPTDERAVRKRITAVLPAPRVTS
jgi:hypothetical protein